MRRWSARGLAGLVMAGFAVFFTVPLIWLLLAITKSGAQLARQGAFTVGSWTSFAANWTVLFSFQGGAMWQWFGNSLLYALGALVLTLAISVPAGYALALTTFRGRRAVLVTTLVVMLMPSTALALPVFLELNTAHLIGTPWSVVLPFSFFPFGVYLAFVYFASSIPRSLLAAARLDGCSELQVFTRVALPLAVPVVALVGFFSFTQDWNNYFLPFVVLPDSSGYPLQVGLAELLTAVPRPVLALATVISVLPVLTVFLFSQRFLVEGMTAGALHD